MKCNSYDAVCWIVDHTHNTSTGSLVKATYSLLGRLL